MLFRSRKLNEVKHVLLWEELFGGQNTVRADCATCKRRFGTSSVVAAPAPAPAPQPKPVVPAVSDNDERLSKLKTVLGKEEVVKQRDKAADELEERRRLEQELASTQRKIKAEKAEAEAAQTLAVRPQAQASDDDLMSDDEIFIDLHGNLHHKGEEEQ